MNFYLWPTIGGTYNLSYFLENGSESLICLRSFSKQFSHTVLTSWHHSCLFDSNISQGNSMDIWLKPVARLANASIHQDLIILRWTDELSFWIIKLKSKPQSRGLDHCNKEGWPSLWDFPTHHKLHHLRLMSAAQKTAKIAKQVCDLVEIFPHAAYGSL